MSESQGKKEFGNINELLAANLDDLADLPAFETPPPGSYILSVKLDVKEVNGKQGVESAFTVVETVELENKDHKEAASGTKFSTVFFLDNEYAIGNLKRFLAPFADHFKTSNIGELVRDHVKDVTIACTIKNRKDKNDPEKVYATVNNVIVQ